MATMTLHVLKPSVNNLTVRIFVRAAGLDFEEVDVWGATQTPEFLAKNPAHLTPMEFARSLLFLPSDLYETVRRLTGVFYRVRYGRADLSPAQQRRLGNVINRVEGALTGSNGA